MNFVGVSTSQQGDSGQDEAFFGRMNRGSHALIVGPKDSMLGREMRGTGTVEKSRVCGRHIPLSFAK